jgi:hypothetical protein
LRWLLVPLFRPLDYEGIPFRCHRCHIYGHGVADCKFPFKGKLWGSLGVDIVVASRHVDLGSGATGDAPVEVSKVHVSGRDRGRHPVQLLILFRAAWTQIEQRYKSPLNWLVQGLSWCRVSCRLLFLRLLLH